MHYSTTNSIYGSQPPNSYVQPYLPSNPSVMQNIIQNTPPPFGSRLSRTMSIPGQVQHQTSTYFDDKPKGLANLHNTCYMNSVLQILFQILDFQLTMDTRAVTRSYKRLHDTHSYQDNQAFKAELEKRLDFVRGYQQQDAQEFLRGLIELLSEENNRYRSYLGKPSKTFEVNPKLTVRQNYMNFM